MKKRTLAAMIATTVILSVGCGPQPANTTTAPVKETTVTETAVTEIVAETTAAETAQANQQETASITGTIDEIKDFMFTIVDDTGEAYPLSFDAEPEGLADVQNGDKVTVTYTGELSREEAFTGTIVSVKKAE